MPEVVAWPAAVRSGLGRLLARYATDLAVEYVYLCRLRRGVLESCIDHTGAEVALPVVFVPLLARLQERRTLLMIDDLETDSVVREAPELDLSGAFLGVGASDNDGSLLGVVLAHGLTPRHWTNLELERAGDMAVGVSGILLLDRLRQHAERRMRSEERAREVRLQMHMISSRSARASSLAELGRILVRQAPSLLDAEWAVVGIRHAESDWEVHVPSERHEEFDMAFSGSDAPGEALLDHADALEAGRADVTAAEVPQWYAVKEAVGSRSARLTAARLSRGDAVSVVLLCAFPDAELDMGRSHLLDELLEDVRRVVERTVLAEQRMRAASALQRSLLPPRVPELPGFEIARLYKSATDHSRVGGDWYDIVKIDASTTGFVVGDVAGHDIRSAAVMGQLRHVLASQLRDRRRPAGALSATDRYFADLDEDVMATAVVIVVDRSTMTAHMALAGHPPPVLLSGPTARLLPANPGSPIGFGYGGYSELAHPLVPGDTLIAYTDGVVENRTGDLSELLDEFVARFESAGRSVHELINLLDRHSRSGELVDDVAALVVKICPEG